MVRLHTTPFRPRPLFFSSLTSRPSKRLFVYFIIKLVCRGHDIALFPLVFKSSTYSLPSTLLGLDIQLTLFILTYIYRSNVAVKFFLFVDNAGQICLEFLRVLTMLNRFYAEFRQNKKKNYSLIDGIHRKWYLVA